jgi:hypothetical protein
MTADVMVLSIDVSSLVKQRHRSDKACPGKVEAGFPITDMLKSKKLERIPIPSKRDAL